MMNEEEFASKMANSLIEKMNDKAFLAEYEGKWIVLLKNDQIDANRSLEFLLKKHKDNVVGSFYVPSKGAVMLL